MCLQRRMPWIGWLLTGTVLLHGGCGQNGQDDISEQNDSMTNTMALEPAAGPTPPVATEIQVEVQGAVHRPGAYAFEAGTRLYDALQRAGGVTPSAEIRDLNLAASLHDGSVLTVPEQESPRPSPTATAAQLNPSFYTRSGWLEQEAAPLNAGTPNSGSSNCTDLNNASSAELETLPGVGPKTAEKIIRYREQQPFTQVDDLRNVQGIGDTRMETLRPLICVGPAQ